MFVMLLPAIGGFFAGMQGQEGIDPAALPALRDTFHMMNQNFSVASDGEIVDFFQGILQNWRTFEERARAHLPEPSPIHETVSLADLDEYSIPAEQRDTRLLPFTYAGQDDQIYIAASEPESSTSPTESDVESHSTPAEETRVDRGNDGEREEYPGSSVDPAMDSGSWEQGESPNSGQQTQIQSGSPDEQSPGTVDVSQVGTGRIDAGIIPDGSPASETGNETDLESLPESDSNSAGDAPQ